MTFVHATLARIERSPLRRSVHDDVQRIAQGYPHNAVEEAYVGPAGSLLEQPLSEAARARFRAQLLTATDGLPDLTDGVLPRGLHRTSIAELALRFRGFDAHDVEMRGQLWSRLNTIAPELERRGARGLLVTGSAVERSRTPRDLDILLIGDADIRSGTN